MSDKPSSINEERIKVTPSKSPEIGIDTDKTLSYELIDAAVAGGLNLGTIDSLVQSAQNREQTSELIDAMSQDDVISAVLETYAEDTVQTNDNGDIIWAEADNANVLDYVTWLLDSLNVNKHIYQWTYCLVTYGDVFVRLFRQSDVEDDDRLFVNKKPNRALNENFNSKFNKEEKEVLDEAIKLKVYDDNDHYIPYVQMVDNPCEMFDLQKFGKTHGYIKAPVRVVQYTQDQMYNYLTRYSMKQSDIEIYDPTAFVHGSLENTNQRQPETIDIFLDTYKKKKDEEERIITGQSDSELQTDTTDSMTTSYSVKRGQSILYNVFRIWREMNLLELSALMNRLTRSAIVRIMEVSVNEMPKEQVETYLQRLKEKVEQKSAMNTNNSMQDYTAAGPIDNTIYIPVYGDKGKVSVQSVGGDFDPKSLVDIEYFRDKLFGALKVPKQFFGQTGDSTGFNGGTSLTIVSARYGKTIKRLQSVMCQVVTDIVNLFLIDRGLETYVNKFKIKMQPPVTQEEIDKRTNADSRLRYVGEIMNQLNDVEDKSIKLKIYKSLLSNVVNDPEVISYLEAYIKTLDAPAEDKTPTETELPTLGESEKFPEMSDLPEINVEEDVEEEKASEILNEKKDDEVATDSYLPSPYELGINCLEKQK